MNSRILSHRAGHYREFWENMTHFSRTFGEAVGVFGLLGFSGLNWSKGLSRHLRFIILFCDSALQITEGRGNCCSYGPFGHSVYHSRPLTHGRF